MTIKEYLQIPDTSFVLSNEHLFIRHHNGEELVMSLHNKQKHLNPNIIHQNTTLANFFQIPITPNHNNTLTLNNQIVYQEIYEKKTYHNAGFIGDYGPIFGLPDSNVLKVSLHPNPKKEPKEEGIPTGRLQELMARWSDILYRPFKLNLTEYLTHSLIPIGDVSEDNLMTLTQNLNNRIYNTLRIPPELLLNNVHLTHDGMYSITYPDNNHRDLWDL